MLAESRIRGKLTQNALRPETICLRAFATQALSADPVRALLGLVDQEQSMRLSGKFRFRKAGFGNLVLQVEEVRKGRSTAREKSVWRNAKPIDLAAPEFRLLMDLSNGRPLIPLSRAAVAVRSDAAGESVSEKAACLAEARDSGSVVVH